jgi:hypothetical protein
MMKAIIRASDCFNGNIYFLGELGNRPAYGEGLAILLGTACLNTGLARGIVALGGSFDRG